MVTRSQKELIMSIFMHCTKGSKGTRIDLVGVLSISKNRYSIKEINTKVDGRSIYHHLFSKKI